MKRCDICCDRGTVRLSVHRRAPTKFPTGAVDAVTLDETSREYPCPECSPKVNEAQVMILQAHFTVPAHPIEDEEESREFDRYMSEAAEHEMMGALRPHMDFKITPYSGPYDDLRATVRIGVVSKGAAVAFDERVKAEAAKVAAEAVDAAIMRMDAWGSHYGYSLIEKGQAARILRDSLQRRAAK